MSSFRPELETCPVCGRKGDCSNHDTYERFVIDFINGTPVSSSINIQRVMCSCGHTHAVLPDPVIPYRCYSLFFILRALYEYFLHLRSVGSLCARFGITPSMLYRWKKLFLEHRREWLGLLASVEESPLASLKTLVRFDPFRDFACSFISKTGITFMQSHRNPAASRQGHP